MSGTSMDGIDAALLRTDGHTIIEALDYASTSYSPIFHKLLKAAEFVVRHHKGNVAAAHLDNFEEAFQLYLTTKMGSDSAAAKDDRRAAALYLHKDPVTLEDVIQQSTHLHAQAVRQLLEKSGYQNHQIDLIGYHGQTLFHAPHLGLTVQLGYGQNLADMLDIAVINDFRSHDITLGGQGAPFAPLYHRALAIRDNLTPVAVVNCGGIGNITIIKGLKLEDITAFDTGPGNGLIDLFVKRRTGFKEHMDLDGKYGLKGKVNEGAMRVLREQSIIREGRNFFKEQPPKSLDINDLKLLPELEELTLEDGCATLETFTARTIVESLDLIENSQPLNFILAGGGWNNPVIMKALKNSLEEKFGNTIKINIADEIGWNNKALEAQIFAYLAVRSIKGQPLSLPQTTRTSRPATGGHLYLPKDGGTEKIQQFK
jgi:anhydro-N-acetylmuramic acid kinase